ncbi:Dihydroorotate dehydrogenase, electron transfer subunit, iron-sulfur cluster binding domain [Solidesulfovibrio carbinoliphilus subsp. oakridgensis]|uniref:Dihydroorotate dehydrogenase, electron transfer subunit, iron-sulfur cluster binding domain n=1 Tax=Solidesulfovibrio carbinoliphilus subsp. oakridgensis TaxID=694327 RepID=G7Q5R0_9BACT|nr:dihydroorotate dehydrogenase [Solidesulfovibrio carbinoliphilus]EHJ49619.1 Dihydroorotate dehydrogenase, electron transfer subunit, iron-sulfur cluster binding domain [Solidesulfovibrio carbinoliphilus subsp. oakridgensis]
MGIAGACRDVAVLSVSPVGEAGPAGGCYILELENPGLAPAVAGQFVMVRPKAFGTDPVWPRPFSICRLTAERLTLFVQVCGRGTDILCRLPAGAEVTVWGPLGQGFALEPDLPTVMLAGGVGIAPFVEYAATHPRPENLSLVFGHRQPLSCYPFDDLAGLVAARAFQEKTPADLPAFVALLDATVAAHADGLVLACGPRPFLVTVARLCRKYSVRGQVSLENRMACGVGGCLGCVEKNVLGSYVQTCTEGPVFWVEELALSEEA